MRCKKQLAFFRNLFDNLNYYKMKMKYFALTALLFLFSCDEGNEVDKPISELNLPGKSTPIETLFDGVEFDNPEHAELLKELKICMQVPDVECPRCAVCSPRFFAIHDLKRGGKVKDFFGLQIKTNTILKGQEFALPVRHLIIFERENGELIKVNGFRGNLIEKIESSSGVDDLIVRFLMKQEDEETKEVEDVWFNCLFKWDGVRYNYESVEAIEGVNWGGAVKPEFKKETSADVYRDLMEGEFIIKDLIIQ